MYSGILVYTLLWLAALLLVYFHYRHRIVVGSKYPVYDSEINNDRKMPIITTIAVALIFTLFNYYATNTSTIVGGDRQNYILNFNGTRATPSVGLQFIMNIVHYFNGDMHALYYITTFVCVLMTMIAYRLSKKATPFAFYLLCITQYFLATLTALKQCYASAFAVLFFVLATEYETKISRIFAIICIVLACLFHPTGYILILIYIILRIEKTRRNLIWYFIALVIVGVFFERVMLLGAYALSPVVPSLASKLLEYFASDSTVTQDGIAISFLKGIPYYLITIIGIVDRKNCRDQIDHYDNYLICTGTGAFIYLMSAYSGWLGRFAYLFSFVSFVFFTQLLQQMTNRFNKMVYSVIVQLALWVTTYRFLFLIYYNYGGF